MSSDDNPRQVNRRSVLRSTSVGVVGATAGGAALSSLLGTVSAEEPTQSDRGRERPRAAPLRGSVVSMGALESNPSVGTAVVYNLDRFSCIIWRVGAIVGICQST